MDQDQVQRRLESALKKYQLSGDTIKMPAQSVVWSFKDEEAARDQHTEKVAEHVLMPTGLDWREAEDLLAEGPEAIVQAVLSKHIKVEPEPTPTPKPRKRKRRG